MKKISLVMALLVALTVAASAEAQDVYFRVNPNQVKDHYMPSDEIIIELYTDLNTAGFAMDSIRDTGAPMGIASQPVANAGYGFSDAGYLVNAGNELIMYAIATNTSPTAPPISGVLYSFIYHVPGVPPSTIIEVFADTSGFNLGEVTLDLGGGEQEIVGIAPALIHVIPEPMTLSLLGLGGLGLLRRRR